MRKIKTTAILVILFIIAGIIVFAVANNDNDDVSHEVGLYYFDTDGSMIVPVYKDITADGQEELYQKIAEALIKGPTGKKYSPIMDKSVKLNSVKNEGGSLTVDFSKEYAGSGLLTTYAVIKSFCRLDDVFRVRVTVNGSDVVGQGFISGDEINLGSDDDSTQGLCLYFADGSKKKLSREYRKINITDTKPVEQYIVAELIKGPTNKNNSKLLASDTGILSVETTDGTCYVNFKRDFIDKNTASAETEKLIIYSIVNSLTERDNINNVQFLIDGKKHDEFGEMTISELFYRNKALIDEQ